MSEQYTLKVSPDRVQEMPMVDLAFEILKSANTPFYYRDLMKEIAKVKGLSEQGMMDVIAYVYTEINTDGRFACVGQNLWGLKRWYPVEKAEDGTVVGNAKRPRIINDDDDDDIDDDIFNEEEDNFEADGEAEDYDAIDQDRDEFYEEEEEEVEEEIIDEEGEEEEEDSELEEGVDELGEEEDEAEFDLDDDAEDDD